MHLPQRLLFCSFLLLLSALTPTLAAIWPWSVPVPSLEGRRAYLWIAPDCPHVRGLVIACQNMLEEPLFERPAFREACAENGLGIVLIFSGHDKGGDDDKNPDHPKRSYLDIFLNPNYPNGPEDPKSAGEDLQKALSDLADESGYQEVRYAPLLPVGHSSAGSFVWHLYRWDPSRIFAMMPFKTGAKDDGPEGIPILDVNSEWFEYGNWDMHNVSLSSLQGGASVPFSRSKSSKILYGYYVDLGNGHCDVSDDCIPIVSLFLKKAVAARIPDDAPLDGPVTLKPVSLDSGWLLDPTTFGKPEGKPIAYADWKDDPKKAFWYLDQEMASAVQNHLVEQLAKQPQQIGFEDNGQVSPDARMSSTSPKFLDDGATFQLQADYVDHIEHAEFSKGVPYYPLDFKLGHSDEPILYRVNSGGLVQVGPDTFRVCPRDGPLLPQGNPWEPTAVAYSLGNAQYRPAEHPIHININIINKGGAAQTLDFPKIPDQVSSSLVPIKLTATASSGLPVQYYVASGPASISNGDTLTFEKIPMRAKFPVRIRVSAFQWGRPNGQQIQSVGPITQEFFIQK